MTSTAGAGTARPRVFARSGAWRARFVLGLVANLAGCDDRRAHPTAPPRSATAIPADAGRVADAPDVAVNNNNNGFASRCPLRGTPPVALDVGGETQGAPAIASNDRDWGVAWSQLESGLPTVFFAIVAHDGARRGNPVRLSEPGYRGVDPSVAWDRDRWIVVWSGGAGRFHSLYGARIDTHGSTAGRPTQITARARDDYAPAIGATDDGLVLVWSAQHADQRWGVYALAMNRWLAPTAHPMRLVDRPDRLAAMALVRAEPGWAASWLVARHDAVVDVMRIDGDARPRGHFARATLAAIGGAENEVRFALAWDGEGFGFAWDEVRDGAPRIYFHNITSRLDRSGEPATLSRPEGSSRSPALAAIGRGLFVAAWEVERDTDRHVEVTAITGRGRVIGERLEVRGHDGRSGVPRIAASRDAVGIATTTGRGIAFHVMPLGPCRP